MDMSFTKFYVIFMVSDDVFFYVQIRMIISKFGIPAVRSAWYDSNQVSEDVVQGYTKVPKCFSFSATRMMPVSFQ